MVGVAGRSVPSTLSRTGSSAANWSRAAASYTFQIAAGSHACAASSTWRHGQFPPVVVRQLTLSPLSDAPGSLLACLHSMYRQLEQRGLSS